MYLTRLQLNTRRRGARQLLDSPQAMHAAVVSGFADPRPTDTGRVLWRLDRYAPHRILLFTASPDKPDFAHIVEQAGWPTTETWETRSYEPLLAGLHPRQRWAFRLTANPVHSVRRQEGRDTQPVAHVTVAQQQQWLLDRARDAGFRIVERPDGECEVSIAERTTHRFRHNGQRSPVTIAAATYQGQLEVTDPDALKRTLCHGLGRAKAYGCGLLTLARPPAGRQR